MSLVVSGVILHINLAGAIVTYIIGLKMVPDKKMKMHLIILLIISCACQSKKDNIQVNNIEDIKSSIEGFNLKELRGARVFLNNQQLSIKDTLISSEGEEWNALAFYFENNLIFIAESNWMDKNNVSRITIYDSKVKTKNGIGVGDSYNKLSPYIIFDSWKDFPDGYIGFKDSEIDRLIYMMDVDSHQDIQDILEGPISEETIPQELRIESILIN